jgi:predicted TIM-barrel fold metal-dependent hydrolase
MLKQRASGNAADADRFYEPMQIEYLDREARLLQLDEQQIERTIMYPGGWALMAEQYLDGIEPLYDNIESFNKWINEDWGFNFKNRIYAPALMSMRDLDRACAELDRILDAGARFIVLPAGPAYGRSPGDPYFDPFWARINEARAVVCYHIAEFFYQDNIASHWGWNLVPPFQFSAWQWQNTYGERPITDTISALIFDNIFGRYRNIKVLVSEFGAEWVPHFIRHMDKSRGMARNGRWLGGQLDERPSTIFKKHVRVVPYPEDDTVSMIEKLGSDETLLMGSDWPHAEGLREPADFYNKVEGLDETKKRNFLRENGMKLTEGIN